MKIALITDQHFGARNDSNHLHNYFSKFYTECFFPHLEKEGITTIIELGDIFDRRKFVNYDSLYRCRDYFFNPIRDKGYTLHCIVGNHDIYFKSTNRVNSPKLLLSEYNYHIYDSATEVVFDNLPILFVPWINSENEKQTHELMQSTKANIVMGHLEFQGFEMYKGHVCDDGISASVFSKFDMVMTGHYHHKSSRGNIHYLGSPYEMTWSDYDDARGFHIFDTETLELKYIQNPFSIFHKIDYNESHGNDILSYDYSKISDSYVKVLVKTKENPYLYDQFIEKISSYNPIQIQVVEYNTDLMDSSIDDIDEAEDTLTIIKNYISNLDLNNTNDVQKLFSKLYFEALNNE
jgi:hypothetical protein